MSWGRLPPEIQLLVFSYLSAPSWLGRGLRDLDPKQDDQPRGWTCGKHWKRTAESILLVSRSWNSTFRDCIIRSNPVDRLIHQAPESLVLAALHARLQTGKIPEDFIRCPLTGDSIWFLDELVIVATYRSLLRCVDLLIRSGAYSGVRMPVQCIGLMSYAVLNMNPAAVRLLISHGAPLEYTVCREIHKDIVYGYTPLGLAIMGHQVEIADILLDAGAEFPEGVDYYDMEESMDPLQFCARSSEDSEMLTVFFRHGVKIDNEKYETCSHPLTLAVQFNSIDVVKTLLEAGARTRDMSYSVSLATRPEIRDLLGRYI